MTPTSRPRVLIVESNEAVNDALTRQLRQEGFRTHLARAGSEAAAVFRRVRIHTTLKEFDLLRLLMENAGQPVSRETLAQHVWGTDHAGCRETLRVHIRHLRAKLRAHPDDPPPITFVPGGGYRFELPAPAGQ